MPILNYTTEIDSSKTVGEIQTILAKGGASKIIVDYDDNRNPVTISFTIKWNDKLVAFSMPCNFQGVMRAMTKNPKVPRSKCTPEQALRVGWRILKDWTEAQLAIVEAELAGMAEVFLPYAVTKDGTTLFKHMENDNKLLLSNG